MFPLETSSLDSKNKTLFSQQVQVLRTKRLSSLKRLCALKTDRCYSSQNSTGPSEFSPLEVNPHSTRSDISGLVLCRKSMKFGWLVLVGCLREASSFVHVAASVRSVATQLASTKLDMSDPAVVTEYNKIKDLTEDSVKYELKDLGIPFNPAAGDMDLKLMLMEARVRLATPTKKEAPGKGATPFEKLIFEKPAVKKAWEAYLDAGDINAANAFVEYVNTPEVAQKRYGDNQIYRDVFDAVERLVKAPAFTSNKLSFDGFPPGMGEDMVKVSFKEFGEITAFTSKGADDPIAESCSGTIEFDSVDAAKAAVAKWDGVDMGLGKKLELKYLP